MSTIDQMLMPSCNFLLFVANFLICNILVGPLVVCYWQGTWRVLDHFNYIKNKEIYYWVVFIIGTNVAFFSSFTQAFWTQHLVNKQNWIFVPVSRVFTYISAFGGVYYWYGIWNLIDFYTGKNLPSAVSTILVGVTCLSSLRALRNLIGAPFNVSVDLDKEHYFKATTRFECEALIGLKFAGDVLLTVFIGGLVTLVWRGTWELLDSILFPHHKNLTIEFSFVIYVSINAFILIIEFPAKIISKHLDDKEAIVIKIIFENCITLIVVTGCVCCWRGIWMFLDHYFLTENKKLAAWLAHLTGYFGLTLCMLSQSVLMKGCTLDGQFTNGDGLTFPSNVLSKMKHFCKDTEEIEGEDHAGTDKQNDNISTITQITHLPQASSNETEESDPTTKRYGSNTDSRINLSEETTHL